LPSQLISALFICFSEPSISHLTSISQLHVHLSIQVRNTTSLGEGEHVDAAKKIIIRARLCYTGCVPALELGNIKTTILSTTSDGNQKLHPSAFDLCFKTCCLFLVGPSL
jgi:hypothetical protein